MDHKTRSALRPVDNSAAETIASISRLRTFREERAAARGALVAQRPRVFGFGENEDIDLLEATILEAERDIEAADMMIAAFEPTIEEKQKAEKRAELAAWRDRLQPLIEAAQEWAMGTYESLVVPALIEGLARERRLMDEVRAYNREAERQRGHQSLLAGENVPANINLQYGRSQDVGLLSDNVVLPSAGDTVPLWPARMKAEPLTVDPAPVTPMARGRGEAYRIRVPGTPAPASDEDDQGA